MVLFYNFRFGPRGSAICAYQAGLNDERGLVRIFEADTFLTLPNGDPGARQNAYFEVSVRKFDSSTLQFCYKVYLKALMLNCVLPGHNFSSLKTMASQETSSTQNQ